MLAALRRIPWGRAAAWSLQNLWNLLRWTVGRFALLIINSAAGFFGWTAKGGVIAVLAKVAAVILILGFIAAALKLHDLATALITLAVAPIMVIGLWMMVRAPFQSSKKKKKKKK